ncbi:hypothetical protein NPN23_25365, partial [Vibrio parahaemolyticus]|nr:hypothetical protein [Vibrio parahaemolyticus]
NENRKYFTRLSLAKPYPQKLLQIKSYINPKYKTTNKLQKIKPNTHTLKQEASIHLNCKQTN